MSTAGTTSENPSPDALRQADAIHWGRVIAVVATLTVWNLVGNLLIPEAMYVPANLAVAVLLVAIAGHRGEARSLVGLDASRFRSGLRLGVGAAIVAGVAIGALAAVPWTREFFDDDRFVGLSVAAALYQAAIRIPVGTALFEELAFRGVLFGLLVRRVSVRSAAGWSALLFGLWHIVPTVALLDQNPAGGYAVGGLAATGLVAGGVMVTAVAGLGFAWLRERSGSLIAPIIVHAAINSTAYVLGWLQA